MKFDDEIKELLSVLDSIPVLGIIDSEYHIAEGSSEEKSAGTFSVVFVLEESPAGWNALEFISRAVAVHRAGSYFIFGLSFRNHKGSSIEFVLDWKDCTANGGYIYDKEIANLSKILRNIIEMG